MMPEREKVIKGLEVCRDQNNPPGYRFTSCVDDCPYHGNGCARKLKEDAIALLKEQEAVVRCKDCKFSKPDWEEARWCELYDCRRYEKWFCADGELAE